MVSTFDRATAVARSELYQKIRQYFQRQDVLEVEVPSLGCGGALDIHIHSLAVTERNETLYLQTSPEYFMKRLLCENSGDIFTICKAFRGGEHGRMHNPEFSMLEWYRLGFSLTEMIEDVLGLLDVLGVGGTCQRLSYAEAFSRATDIDPHQPDLSKLEALAREHGMLEALELPDLLDFIAASVLEPSLPKGLVALEAFPACQAELAKLKVDASGGEVASRFELYLDGVEIANGYEELTDGAAQRARFETGVQQRKSKNIPEIGLDEEFLAAVERGMPECAGVALGLDRLLMNLMGQERLSQSLCFSRDRL